MASKEKDTAALFALGPLVDDTDFKSLETGVAYDASGVDFSLYEETQAGVTKTAITPTTAGSQDWVELGDGYYTIEVTAAQLNTAGIAWVAGFYTGILPFESVHYDVIDPADAALLSLFVNALSVNGKLDGGSFEALEDSVPADGSFPSLTQAAYMTVQRLTDFEITGTTLTVRKPDGSTTLYTLTLNSTTPSSSTRAT